jgi:hypothetical protein
MALFVSVVSSSGLVLVLDAQQRVHHRRADAGPWVGHGGRPHTAQRGTTTFGMSDVYCSCRVVKAIKGSRHRETR